MPWMTPLEVHMFSGSTSRGSMKSGHRSWSTALPGWWRMGMRASVGKRLAGRTAYARASGVTWYCRTVVRTGMGSPPPSSVSAATRKFEAPSSSVARPGEAEVARRPTNAGLRRPDGHVEVGVSRVSTRSAAVRAASRTSKLPARSFEPVPLW